MFQHSINRVAGLATLAAAAHGDAACRMIQYPYGALFDMSQHA